MLRRCRGFQQRRRDRAPGRLLGRGVGSIDEKKRRTARGAPGASNRSVLVVPGRREMSRLLTVSGAGELVAEKASNVITLLESLVRTMDWEAGGDNAPGTNFYNRPGNHWYCSTRGLSERLFRPGAETAKAIRVGKKFVARVDRLPASRRVPVQVCLGRPLWVCGGTSDPRLKTMKWRGDFSVLRGRERLIESRSISFRAPPERVEFYFCNQLSRETFYRHVQSSPGRIHRPQHWH
jgi:hypothetical protein